MTYPDPRHGATPGDPGRDIGYDTNYDTGREVSYDPGRDVSGASVGELVSLVTRDLSTLMRQELALAKAEVKEEAVKAGRAGGMLGGAGSPATWYCCSPPSPSGGDSAP